MFGASSVSAENIYCTGKVANVYIDSSGNVVIFGKWRNDWTRICNTQNSDTVTCSLWASYVASAVKDNLSIKLQYNVSDGTTCENLPTYANAPNPGYVMLLNPN